jgi:HPt (histidine-containing phosphotransfer) domain-containing protein
MLNIDALRSFGADVEDGLNRCMNNEAMYLQLVDMALGDANFDKLARAVEAGDRKEAFDAAHTIKGVMGNLSLTPLFEVSSEMTELLRADKDADYPSYLERILGMRDELLAMK